MRLNAYAIYDNKALVYFTPFYAPTDGAAARSFSDMVNDSSTGVARHPSDYVLYCVGAYDDQKGELLPISPLRHVADAAAFIKVQSELPLTGVSVQPTVDEYYEREGRRPNGGK